MTQLSSQDDNCQHTRFWFHIDAMVSIYPLECRWKQFMNFVIIVGTDPFALKQSKRVKLLQGSFVLFVCENFQYFIPNPTDGSMFIALEGTQRLSRGHVHHFAIKTYCRHRITVRHLTRITGSPRRMKSTGPRPRPRPGPRPRPSRRMKSTGHVGLFRVGASHEAREYDKLRSNVVVTRQAEKQRGF